MQRQTFFLSAALGLLALLLCFALAPTPPTAAAPMTAETPTMTPTDPPTGTPSPTATPLPTPTATPTVTQPLGRPLTCADVPAEVHCVLLDPMVRYSRRLGPQWRTENATDETAWVSITYQDITGTAVFTAQIGLYPHSTNNFYLSDEQVYDIPIGFNGSALLTSTTEFSASIYPQTVQCQQGELNCSVLSDISISQNGLTVTGKLTRFYTVVNPLPVTNEITSRFYVYNTRICELIDTFAPGESRVYDMVYEIQHRGWPACAVPGEGLAAWARRAGTPASGAAAWALAASRAPLVRTQATSATTTGGAAKLTAQWTYVAGRGLLEWGGSVLHLPIVLR